MEFITFEGVSKLASIPKKWTQEDINQLVDLKKQGLPIKEIARIMGRTVVSVSVKHKRLQKVNGKYNANHIEEKTNTNIEFEEYIKPDSLLNLYSGGERYYKSRNIVRNDKSKEFETDYHEDALKLLCKFYYEGKKFDYIDIDPFGSAYECFDLALKIAKKGIAITFGEYGHRRFNRLDYVSTRYNIYSKEDFTVDNLTKEVQKIAHQNKKELIVYKQKDWGNICRVWFIIKPESKR